MFLIQRTKPKIWFIFFGFVFFISLFPCKASAANNKPQPRALNPSTGASNPNKTFSFTATYTDANGWKDIQNAQILINDSINGSSCFYGYYNRKSNRLYLRDNNNTKWVGGFAPGSAKVIENSYVKVYCSKTTVSGSGNNLTLKWSVSFKTSFSGIKNIYLYAKDNRNTESGFIKKGEFCVFRTPKQP